MDESETPTRRLFHRTDGGIDVARLLEQLIPAAVMGCVVVFANLKVTEYQVASIQKQLDLTGAEVQVKARQLQDQSERLAGISAQVAAFLGQQVQINQTLNDRLTYMERNRVLR